MPDQAPPELPRIALVFGDAAAVAHVREAVSGCVDIVYAAPAGDFDTSRMDGARATLVNLDDGDWLDSLDSIETKLNDAGVAVVFNDPEISQGLEGWERARWLRHLVAKLRGSTDVDPPRPRPVEAEVTTAAGPHTDDVAVDAAAEVPVPTSTDNVVVARPLTHEEITTMTADFVAEQDPAPAQTSNSDFDSEGNLDVDTEELSAMIDARLAEPESQTPSGSSEVWRVVSGGAVSQAQLATATTNPDPAPAAGTDAVPTSKLAEASAVAGQDDADVLAGLPSLDDWQLVGPETPAAPSADKSGIKPPDLAFLDSLAGLELVPMETIVPAQTHADPIEMWLDDGEPGKTQTASVRANAAGGKS